MTCPAQLSFDLTPAKRRAIDCPEPGCQPACGLHTVCPYARDAASTRFLSEYRRGRVMGPLAWFAGRWLETVLGCNPWGGA